MKKEIAYLTVPLIALLSYVIYNNVAETAQVYEESIMVFEQNIVFIDDEIVAGENCLEEITKTAQYDGPACTDYVFKKDVSEDFTEIGINLLVALFNEGYLIEGEEEFETILALVEELAVKDFNAKLLNDEIVNRVGNKCVKCAI